MNMEERENNMDYEILSIDRLDEHEKLIRENGSLREERNKLQEIINKAKEYINDEAIFIGTELKDGEIYSSKGILLDVLDGKYEL